MSNAKMQQTQELLARFGIPAQAEGWGALDPQEQAKREHAQKMLAYEAAQRIAQCFSGTAGQAALQDLRARFVDPPTWPVIATGQGDTLAHGCTREGQKSVIKWLENCIAIAASPPPAMPTEGAQTNV